MANHPNRNWRKRWTVDLERCRATHQDGFVFLFSGGELGWSGVCEQIKPGPHTTEDMQRFARIAREADDIWREAIAKTIHNADE